MGSGVSRKLATLLPVAICVPWFVTPGTSFAVHHIIAWGYGASADARAEILLLSSSILVPGLTHGGVKEWDTLAIAEYLAEAKPKAGLLPAEREAPAHCRLICGERTMADAMYAPVAARFATYEVTLDAVRGTGQPGGLSTNCWPTCPSCSCDQRLQTAAAKRPA